jgi:hypothetical protein
LVTGQEPHPDEQPEVTDLPWSPDHPWSVVYLDEGPPLPAAGHQSWQWRIEPTSFMRHHLTAPLEPDLLIADKLDRLMQRYEGELEGLPKLKTGEPIRRLQFPALEKLDVVTGLLDFAEISPAHLERLRALYAAGRRKPLGAEVTLDSLRERRGELRRVLSATN